MKLTRSGMMPCFGANPTAPHVVGRFILWTRVTRDSAGSLGKELVAILDSDKEDVSQLPSLSFVSAELSLSLSNGASSVVAKSTLRSLLQA